MTQGTAQTRNSGTLAVPAQRKTTSGAVAGEYPVNSAISGWADFHSTTGNPRLDSSMGLVNQVRVRHALRDSAEEIGEIDEHDVFLGERSHDSKLDPS